MIKSVFDRVNVPLFSKFLDASTTQQRVVAENIANVNTPGYKAKEVDFADILRTKTSDFSNAVIKTNERHVDIGKTDRHGGVKVNQDKSLELDSLENNVDIDSEMVKSVKNQLFYTATARIVFGKFKALHTSIRGRV
jgi:flagellar basal-body rod protein FlgB